jgi:hypothetical protein
MSRPLRPGIEAMFRGCLFALICTGMAAGQTRDSLTLESNSIHNNADVALTAFVYRSESTLRFYDSLMNPLDRPVLADQSVRIPGATNIRIEAGIFGYGASFGDPALVTRILHRRHYMIATINRATADVRREMAVGMKKNDIVEEFRATMNREMQEAVDDDERDMIQSVRSGVIRSVSETLRDGVMPVLPYQAMSRQIAILEQRRGVLLSGVPR